MHCSAALHCASLQATRPPKVLPLCLAGAGAACSLATTISPSFSCPRSRDETVPSAPYMQHPQYIFVPRATRSKAYHNCRGLLTIHTTAVKQHTLGWGAPHSAPHSLTHKRAAATGSPPACERTATVSCSVRRQPRGSDPTHPIQLSPASARVPPWPRDSGPQYNTVETWCNPACTTPV